MYTFEKKKKINKKHAYIIFITLFALISLVGNIFQNVSYANVEEINVQEYNTLYSQYKQAKNKTVYLSDENRNVTIEELQNLYEDLKKEYTELYYSGN